MVSRLVIYRSGERGNYLRALGRCAEGPWVIDVRVEIRKRAGFATDAANWLTEAVALDRCFCIGMGFMHIDEGAQEQVNFMHAVRHFGVTNMDVFQELGGGLTVQRNQRHEEDETLDEEDLPLARSMTVE